jgi:putative oxygen-independent coproporphyrinogen III oxidase
MTVREPAAVQGAALPAAAIAPSGPSAAPAPVPARSAVVPAPAGLYIHVPFCVSLCPYCDFVVYPGAAARGARSRMDAFVGALLAEIRLRADGWDAAVPVRAPLGSVYLGGGTPSLLPPHHLAEIVALARARFGIAGDAEVTLEANPGPQERGDLAAAAAAGVTRVSFGAQSFDAAELRRLGRRHTAADVERAVADARESGIRSVSIDLLYDVPGQGGDSFAASLEAALALAPDHLSLYALTLDDPAAEGLTGVGGDHLPTPPGARRWRDRARRDQDDERAAAQYQAATARLGADGWRGYEISNWARPGHESRHNLAYWRRLPFEAVGPGAHAFDGRRRRWNAARLDAYVTALAGDRLPPGGSEEIDDGTAEMEAVMLALRTDDGVAADAARAARFQEPLTWALANALATLGADGRVRLTTRGRLLSNEVFARLV